MSTPFTPGQGRGGDRAQGMSLGNGALNSTPPRPDRRNGQIRYARIWISDLISDSYRLSPTAMGAYVRIYCAIVTAQAPIIDDAKTVGAITGTTRRAWRGIRDELLAVGVLDLIDGHLHDPRAQRAIDEFQAASRRNRNNVEHRYRVVADLEDSAS